MDIRSLNLESDKYYHIYNRGINSGKVFKTNENYNYFLKLLSKYILNIADVYAYCLMPNHFHILLKIKTREEIEEFLENSKPTNSTIEGLHSIKNIASKQLSKFIIEKGHRSPSKPCHWQGKLAATDLCSSGYRDSQRSFESHMWNGMQERMGIVRCLSKNRPWTTRKKGETKIDRQLSYLL